MKMIAEKAYVEKDMENNPTFLDAHLVCTNEEIIEKLVNGFKPIKEELGDIVENLVMRLAIVSLAGEEAITPIRKALEDIDIKEVIFILDQVQPMAAPLSELQAEPADIMPELFRAIEATQDEYIKTWPRKISSSKFDELLEFSKKSMEAVAEVFGHITVDDDDSAADIYKKLASLPEEQLIEQYQYSRKCIDIWCETGIDLVPLPKMAAKLAYENIDEVDTPTAIFIAYSERLSSADIRKLSAGDTSYRDQVKRALGLILSDVCFIDIAHP